METVKINVGGMTCGGCVKSVTTVLEQLEGVNKADVDLDSASAKVTFDPAKVQTAALLEAVEDAGFDASL
ncbi:heavy-metal-associated domain-containing protein [Neisseria zalophi]|uniref:Heavy-metal-associated domain-containing protein n=1 Tax=Neisseria zalophi TaxID=640030 RepID=A0A5J6Q157_9NEIS|nr:cation transporter [Neisseria zalophi]QEY26680.1 heavy-metal-associated domain-containing protein [Neisseria zalophi]